MEPLLLGTQPGPTNLESLAVIGRDYAKISSKPLYEGACGVLYKATDTQKINTFVIKYLKRPAGGDLGSYRALVTREYANMKRGHHKYVCEAIALAKDEEDAMAVILPYFAQGDLLGFLSEVRRNKNLIPGNLRDAIFKQIVAGTTHLHAENIVHRDLKPENCLIANDGTIKISDFGYSLDLSGDQDVLWQEVLSNRHEICCGTTSFKAPELFQYETAFDRLNGHPSGANKNPTTHTNTLPHSPKAQRLPSFTSSPNLTAVDAPVPNPLDTSQKVVDDIRHRINFKALDCWALGIFYFNISIMTVPWNAAAGDNRSYGKYAEHYPNSQYLLISLAKLIDDKSFSTRSNPALELFRKIHYDARVELLKLLHPDRNKRLECADLLKSQWLTQVWAKPGDLLKIKR